MSFITDIAKAKKFVSGNKFTGGRGVAILKDVKVFKSNKPGGDPYTWCAELLIKSSHESGGGTPNLPGTSASSIQQPTKSQYPDMALSNIKQAHEAFLGPGSEALTEAQLEAVTTALLRPFGAGNPLEGRTDPAKPCPERGRQVGYETTKGKDGNYYPKFFAIPQTDADLAENLKLLAGADAAT